MDNKKIEIPFGAKDSELCGWEYTIPEGMEAVIENGKVIVRRKENEDERLRRLLVWQVYRNIEDETNDLAKSVYDGIKGHDPDLEESIEDWKKCLAYLERQKEQPEVDLDALVNEAFDKYSSIDGYGQLAVSFNRAELYSFIKKIARKEE